MTLVAGISGPRWRACADRVCVADRHTVLALAGSISALTVHLRRNPCAKSIIFAECPWLLITEGAADPDAALKEWTQSAATILALCRRHRGRVTILNLSECLSDPAGLDEWINNRFGSTSSSVPPLPPATESSLVRQVLAHAIASRNSVAARLWKELLAVSQPISSSDAVLAPPCPQRALAEISQQQKHLAEERAALTNQLASLESANSSLSTRHSELLAEHDALQSKHFSLIAERDSLAQKLKRTSQLATDAHNLLLQEILNAHQESEHFFEQWKSLEASVAPHCLTAERILRGGEKHHPPHRHLDFVFESVSLFERRWERLPVRLVEHRGNAGLAVFDPASNGAKPLYHWEPSGQESGQDFMLLVPSNAKAAAKLVSFPTSDLLLAHDATAKILGHLSVHEGREADCWLPVARRLLQEIEEIPERLHYDSVSGFVNGGAGHPLIRFNAANLYFRGNCARAFVLDWTPAPSGGTLLLKPSEADTPMLVSSAPEVIIGFASNEEEDSIRKLWLRLTAHDQAFLLLLAKALPDFVFHLCEQHPDQKPHKERLTKQARKLYRRLCSLDRRLKLRSAIAKAIRR